MQNIIPNSIRSSIPENTWHRSNFGNLFFIAVYGTIFCRYGRKWQKVRFTQNQDCIINLCRIGIVKFSLWLSFLPYCRRGYVVWGFEHKTFICDYMYLLRTIMVMIIERLWLYTSLWVCPISDYKVSFDSSVFPHGHGLFFTIKTQKYTIDLWQIPAH